MSYFKKFQSSLGAVACLFAFALPTMANAQDLFTFTPQTDLAGKGVASGIQDPHQLYFGTRFTGSEYGIRANMDYIYRFGGELEGKQTINNWDCHPDSGFYCTNGVFLDFVFAGSGFSYSGGAIVGTDGTLSTGFTTNNSGAYVGSIGAGGELRGTSNATNLWGRFDAGYEKDLHSLNEMDGAGNYNPQFNFRANPFFEFFSYDGSGRSETYNAGVATGDYQTYSIQSNDWWAGVSGSAEVVLPIESGLLFLFGGRLDLGYHSGRGDFSQTTVAPGMTTETQSFSTQGFTVGGGVNAGVSYEISQNVRLETELKVDVLPSVTGFNGRYGPLDAVGMFAAKNLGRATISAGVMGSFN